MDKQTYDILNTIVGKKRATKTSDLENDSGFVVDSTYVHTDNNFTTAEKEKLASVEGSSDFTEVKADIAGLKSFINDDSAYTTTTVDGQKTVTIATDYKSPLMYSVTPKLCNNPNDKGEINPWTNDWKGIDYPALKVMGYIQIQDTENNIIYKSDTYDLYASGYADNAAFASVSATTPIRAYDTLTEQGLVKQFSDKIYLTADNLVTSKSISVQSTSSQKHCLFVFKFTEEDLQEYGLPKQYSSSEVADILASKHMVVTNDRIQKEKQTIESSSNYNGYYSQYVAFYYDTTDECWYLTLVQQTDAITYFSDGTIDVLSTFNHTYQGNMWFIYKMAEQKLIPHNIQYVENGYKVSFVNLAYSVNNTAYTVYADKLTVSVVKNLKAVLDNLSTGVDGLLNDNALLQDKVFKTVVLTSEENYETEIPSDTINGVLDFEITAGNCGSYGSKPYNYQSSFTNADYPSYHTLGRLSVYDTNGNLSDVLDDFDLYGTSGAYDILSSAGVTRYLSDKVYLKSSMLDLDKSVYDMAFSSSYKVGKFVLKLSESVFDDIGVLPEQYTSSDIASILVPGLNAKSIQVLSELSTYYAPGYVGMEYSSDDNCYYLTIITVHVGGGDNNDITVAFETLFKGKLWMKYRLTTPNFVPYNLNKLYIDSGYTVKFETISDIYDGTALGIDTEGYTFNFEQAPSSIKLYIPQNIKGSLDGFDSVVKNLNVLNDRIDNVVTADGGTATSLNLDIGATADGVTDDYNTIKDLIKSAVTVADANNKTHRKVVTIPAGVYAVSQPIILEDSFIHFKGDGGEVIIRPTGYFPAIIMQANDQTVSDLIIQIPMITESTEEYKALPQGWHSGIYTRGWADRLKVENVLVRGAYGYHNQNIERSYGIYISGSESAGMKWGGGQYFPTITRVDCGSVYCGVYIGSSVPSAHIDFMYNQSKNHETLPLIKTDVPITGGLITTDDDGNTVVKTYNDDEYIYAKPNTGCAYGCILKGGTATVDFAGQNIGDNNDPLFFTHVVAAKINDEYSNPQANNLTKAAVLVESGLNSIQGYAYDPQRADHAFIFTSTAYSNRYMNYANSITNENISPSYHILSTNNDSRTGYWSDDKGSVDSSLVATGEGFYYNIYREVVLDSGKWNVSSSPLTESVKPVSNFGKPLHIAEGDYALDTAPADYSNYSRFYNNDRGSQLPTHYGWQDNYLSYVDKWGSVDVYTTTNVDDETARTPVTYNNGESDYGVLFNPTASGDGLLSTLIFDSIPKYNDETSWIYMDIKWDYKDRISRMARFIANFGIYPPSYYAIYPLCDESHTLVSTAVLSASQGQNTSTCVGNVMWHQGQNTWFWALSNVTGLRIIFKQGLSYEATTKTYQGVELPIPAFNEEGKVSINNIFVQSATRSGNTWLSKNGGEIYGDLTVQNDLVVQNPKTFDNRYLPKTTVADVKPQTQYAVESDAVNYKIYGNTTQETAIGKNLIPYPYYNSTKTANGITFTVNIDGSITANGTATADAIFWLTGSRKQYDSAVFLSGCPENGSKDTYYLTVTNDLYKDVGAGVSIPANSSLTYYVKIMSGTTVENLVFKPQLEAGIEATEYERYKITSPSPSQKSEIESVGDLVTDETDEHYGKYKVETKVRGKNLFGGEAFKKNAIENGLTVNEENNTVSIYANAEAKNKIIYNGFKTNTQYTIMFKGTNSSTNYSTNTNICIMYTDGTYTHLLFNSNNSKTCYVSTAGKTINYISGFYGAGTGIFDIGYFGIFEGVLTTSDFEPYKEQTVATYLDEPLRKVGSYSDYIDWDNQCVVRNVKQVDFSDATIVENDIAYHIGVKYINSFLSSQPTYDNTVISDTFKDYLDNGNVQYQKITGIARNPATLYTNVFYCCISKIDYPDMTLEEAQDIIHNSKNYAVAGTPTTEPITVEVLPLEEDINNINVTTTIQPSNIEIEYYQNPADVINELRQAILSLGGNV